MVFFSIALASALACQPVSDAGQVGLWESTGTSMGGIGGNIEFGSNGFYYSAMVVIVDFVYKIENGVLLKASDKGGAAEFQKGVPITPREEGYIILGAEGEEELRNRIGEGSADSIVGVYSYRHYTGAIAYEKFTEDGSLRLRIPMKLEIGCYEIDGEEMILRPENGDAKSYYFQFEDHQLQLDDLGKVSTFNPVSGGAWYHVDEVDYVKPKWLEQEK